MGYNGGGQKIKTPLDKPAFLGWSTLQTSEWHFWQHWRTDARKHDEGQCLWTWSWIRTTRGIGASCQEVVRDPVSLKCHVKLKADDCLCPWLNVINVGYITMYQFSKCFKQNTGRHLNLWPLVKGSVTELFLSPHSKALVCSSIFKLLNKILF